MICLLTSSSSFLVGCVRSLTSVAFFENPVTARPRESARKFGVAKLVSMTAGTNTGTVVLPLTSGTGREFTTTSLVVFAEIATVGSVEGTKDQFSKNSQLRPVRSSW